MTKWQRETDEIVDPIYAHIFYKVAISPWSWAHTLEYQDTAEDNARLCHDIWAKDFIFAPSGPMNGPMSELDSSGVWLFPGRKLKEIPPRTVLRLVLETMKLRVRVAGTIQLPSERAMRQRSAREFSALPGAYEVYQVLCSLC